MVPIVFVWSHVTSAGKHDIEILYVLLKIKHFNIAKLNTSDVLPF